MFNNIANKTITIMHKNNIKSMMIGCRWLWIANEIFNTDNGEVQQIMLTNYKLGAMNDKFQLYVPKYFGHPDCKSYSTDICQYYYSYNEWYFNL